MSGWSAVHELTPLPALYVALLALALWLLLRRWFDPVPGRVMLLFLAYVGALLAPVLAGDAVLLPVDVLRLHAPFTGLPASAPPAIALQRDLVHQIAPWALAVKRALGGGRWPLWNARQGAGMPLMADPQAQAFQPLVWLAYPFSIWTAAGVTAALKVLLALTASYLLLRRQGLGEAAACAGATGFGLGGFVLIWLGWPIATAAAWLPVVLYALVRCDEVGARRDFLLLAACCAALLLAGHPETIAYVGTLAGLFLLDRCRRRRSRRAGLELLARAGSALLLAMALVSPVLFPTLTFLPKTQRHLAIETSLAPVPVAELWRDLTRPETLALWRQRSLRRLVPIVAPNAFGDLRTAYWGSSNYVEDVGEFAGSLMALFALTALGVPRPGARRFPQERLMTVALAASLALMAQPPGFERLAARLPLLGFTAVHKHHRIQVLVVFCLCYLAACQIERWTRGELRWRALAPGLAAALAVVALAYLTSKEPGHRDPWDLRIDWLWLQLKTLAMGAVCLAAGRAGRRPPPWAPWLVGAAVAAELLAFHLPSVRPNDRRLAFPPRPALRFLAQHLDGNRLVGARQALPANFALVYGLDDVRCDDPAVPAAYARATAFLDRGILEPRFINFGHPFYDFLGVRFVISAAGARLPLRLAFAGADARVWERPEPLPRLFLPERAQIDRGGDWGAWLEANPDFGLRALVEPDAEVHRRWRARRPDASRLRLDLVQPMRLHAAAMLAEPRLLAAGIYQDGAWRVLAGGSLLPALKVNGTFVGAWLPAGETTIDLLYRPAELLWGCLLAALATAAAAWWLAPPRRRSPTLDYPRRDPRARQKRLLP